MVNKQNVHTAVNFCSHCWYIDLIIAYLNGNRYELGDTLTFTDFLFFIQNQWFPDAWIRSFLITKASGGRQSVCTSNIKQKPNKTLASRKQWWANENLAQNDSTYCGQDATRGTRRNTETNILQHDCVLLTIRKWKIHLARLWYLCNARLVVRMTALSNNTTRTSKKC